jgi:hypothetical protein
MLWVLKMVGIFLIDSMSIRNDIWISLSDIFFLQGNIEKSAAFCKLNVCVAATNWFQFLAHCVVSVFVPLLSDPDLVYDI